MLRHIFYLVLCFPLFLCGQSFRQAGNFVYKTEFQLLEAGAIQLPAIPSTAIVIKSIEYQGSFIQILIEEETLAVPLDPDALEFTFFLSYPKTEAIEVMIENRGSYQFFLINSGRTPGVNSSFRMEGLTDCIAPVTSIPQSEWRAGLPEPSYSRIETEVEHVVVHHSAGSNTNQDFTQVVRDIYIYHTEVNGWSDIGYNYLIAQDGSIYNGRDPGNLAQDNVLGAHFCGSNSTTMGVCLLGNFQTASITTSTRLSLQNLVAWKLEKENLTPYVTHQHDLGLFEAVIGHRDGCSTLCPGENIYDLIGAIKADVNSLITCDDPIAKLDFETRLQVVKARSAITFSNLSNGYESYEWVFEGGIPESANWSGSGTVTYHYPGVFDVTLIGIYDGIRDTLSRSDYVEIQGEPIVFPNPTKSLNPLAIQYNYEITHAELFAMDGQQLDLEELNDGTYQLPYLRPGLYLIKIHTPRKVVGRKIVVK